MKTHFILTIILLSLLTILLFAEAATANPVGIYGSKPKYASVTVDSPTLSPQLAFTIKTNHYWATGANLSDTHCLILLGSSTVEASNLTVVSNITVSNDYAYTPYTHYRLRGTIDLSKFASLPNGTYDIQINYGYYNYGFVKREYTVEFVTLGNATSKTTLAQDLPETPLASPEASSASPTSSKVPSSPQDTPTSVQTQVSSNDSFKQILLIALILAICSALPLLLLFTFKRCSVKKS